MTNSALTAPDGFQLFSREIGQVRDTLAETIHLFHGLRNNLAPNNLEVAVIPGPLLPLLKFRDGR